MYEWAVFYADDKLDGDVCDSSITDCLQGAIAAVPMNSEHVEIRYRGVHMGTYRVEVVAERPDLIADQINEAYAALF